MTKLTTERLEEIAKLEITEFSNGMDIAKDAYQSVGSSEIVLMARQLLAYEQAAEHPAARITWDGSEFSVSNVSEDFLYGGTAVYLAPVLPKQPELVENLKKVMNSWLAMEPKLAFQPEFTDVMMLLDGEPAPAQPVIPEQANILGYFSFDPEDGAEILKDRQTAIDNCNASIDLYRESMQEEYPDGWSDDVKRVCWGVILQEARGFDAQGIPENDPNHTYQTLDYRLYPDSTNTVTAQPVSNPYKLKDAVEDIRNSGVEIDTDKIKAERDALNSPVIPDGWKLVPVNATRAMIDAAARVEEDGYDAMHKAMLAAAPAQESE